MPVTLDKTVERCNHRDFLKINPTEDAPPEAVEEAASLNRSLEEYFAPFAAPSTNCLKCETAQGGLAGLMLGGFTWGIVHGEGRCATCGWPGRALHYPKDENGEDILDRPLRMILQYHPDEVGIDTGD